MQKKKNRIEQLALNIGLIVFDFDGVFTDNKVIIDEKGQESIVCNRADGVGLTKLKELEIDLLILSSEPNAVVWQRAKKLKIRCINNCENKLKILFNEAKRKDLSLAQVAYVGNDINDIECLKAVGLPIVVADSHKDILRYGKYRTKKNGGYGAVREICDFIYAVKTREMPDVKSF